MLLTTPPELICTSGEEVRALRRSLATKQDQFWARIGIKQSAGSRYESDSNPLPLHVAWLLHIAYGTPAQCERLVAWLRQG